jgi:hypothetical protein
MSSTTPLGKAQWSRHLLSLLAIALIGCLGGCKYESDNGSLPAGIFLTTEARTVSPPPDSGGDTRTVPPLPENGDIPAGTYLVLVTGYTAPYEITVPHDWSATDGEGLAKDDPDHPDEWAAFVGWWPPTMCRRTSSLGGRARRGRSIGSGFRRCDDSADVNSEHSSRRGRGGRLLRLRVRPLRRVRRGHHSLRPRQVLHPLRTLKRMPTLVLERRLTRNLPSGRPERPARCDLGGPIPRIHQTGTDKRGTRRLRLDRVQVRQMTTAE